MFPVCALTAQSLQVTNATTAPFTPENLISNIFLGDGVEVTNITYNGQAISVGYFTGGQQSIGLERGIVMTTGRSETGNPALNEYGSSEPGNAFANNIINGLFPGTDPDLAPLASGALYDIGRYTITFVPTSDTLRFRYVFASEEYPEFGCSNFNDIFGFFIQGPNYPTPTNIALIPGTSLPVSINNIHPVNPTTSNCPAKNEQYFVDNNGTNKPPVYDGFTRVFTAEAIVVPCETYTIKLAIADVADPNYDSGVFLEAKSFGTGALRAALNTPSLDGTITEGCSAGSLTFRLPTPATEDYPIDFTILGNAVNGLDYQTIPANLVIPAGQQEIVIPIVAFEDGLSETGEFLAIDVRRDPCNRDTIQIVLRDNLLAPPDQLMDTSYCIGAQAVTLNGTLPVPQPPPPIFSNSQDFSINPVNTTITSPITVFGVIPPVLQPGMIRSVCLNIAHNWVDDLDVYLVSPGGQFLELMTDCGADGKNFTNTCFTPAATKLIGQSTKPDAPFTGDWQPEGPWSDLWSGAYPVNGNWKLQLKDDGNGFVGTLNDWTITFEPLYEIKYQWSPAAGLSCADCPVPLAQPDVPTTYHLLAVDSYGCTLEDSVQVNVLEPLAAPVVSCAGFTNNSISFSWPDVAGATGYQVNVNGAGWILPSGLNNHVVNGLNPGTLVTIEVQPINDPGLNCPGPSGTALCVNCDQPQVESVVTGETCTGQANGSIVLSTDNLNPPYTFNLGSQQNSTGVFNNLAPGNYTATVTDNSGCFAVLPFTVSEAPNLEVQVESNNITCFGGDNGTATANALGGSGVLDFQWNDPANQNLASAVNLVAGTYTVTVTDQNGCSTTASATLSQPPDLQLAVTTWLTKCSGDSTGQAAISVNGGIAPYNYSWSNGQSGALATNLAAGNYTVTVTDNAGCAKTSFALIGSPAPLTATIDSLAATCANLATGAAIVSAQGGSGALTYQWNDPAGQTTETASNLAAGTYTVTISDQNGCQLSLQTTVTAPPAIFSTTSHTDARCFGTATGSASVAASGGAGNFIFQWSDPDSQTSMLAQNLSAGTYTVTVSDANGCTATNSVLIAQPAALGLLAVPTQASCFGLADGAVSTQVQGGTPPLSFIWNSGETSPGISNKIAGGYSVTVTDAAGCTVETSATITAPDAIHVGVVAQNIDCFGAATGTAKLEISGGSGGYSVLWNGPNGFVAPGLEANNLIAGTYSATVTDAAGCTFVQAVIIAAPASALEIGLPAQGDTICFGANNGGATATPSGGTPPYSYQWSPNNQNTATASGLSAGLYRVLVTDAKNCTAIDSVYIPQKEPMRVEVQSEPADCFGANTGTAKVAGVFYGTMQANPSQLTWKWNTTPVQTGPLATGLLAGQTYTVTVTDQQGCSATQTATIGAPAPVFITITRSAPPSCFNGSDGSIIVLGSGGVAPYSYAWGASVVDAVDSLAFNLPAGNYQVTVVDARGCTGTTGTTLGQPDALEIEFQVKTPLCFGDSSAQAAAIPSGGTPPYQYSWVNGAQTNTLQNLPAGTYPLTLTDKNGCVTIDSAVIGQPNALSGTSSKKDIGCLDEARGEILLTGSGGTPPYRYALNGGSWTGSPVQIGLQAGFFVPRILDKNGCVVELPPVEVLQQDPVLVDLGPSVTIIFGESTQLLAEVSNAVPPVQYSWQAADSLWLSCLDCQAPFVQGLEFARWFEIQVTDSLGCSASDRILVTVEKVRKVFVPTGFSPNGDGANDLLLAHGQQTTKVLAFQVFDRWGELLYEGGGFHLNDTNAGWDGTFRGLPVNPGVYVWVLEVEYSDGVQETFRGSTSLLR
ncbi:MAG: choice-of-anchor L domain-containing protein [Saprospiraceae bacterium]